ARGCTPSPVATIPTRRGSRTWPGRSRSRYVPPRATVRCPNAASPCRPASRPGTWPSTVISSPAGPGNDARWRPSARARTARTAARCPAQCGAPVLVDAAVDVAGVGADVPGHGRLAGDEDRTGRGPAEPGAVDRVPGGQPLPSQG